MAISAQRFKFFDRETNIPIKDFTRLVDSYVYNIPGTTNIAGQLSDLLQNQLGGLLSDITSNLPDVDSLISGGFAGADDIVNSLKSSMSGFNNLLNQASSLSNLFKSIGGLSIGNYASDLLGGGVLGGLVSNALTGFVSNSIKSATGSRLTFLTNSICKSGSRNYNVNLDILSLLGLKYSSGFLSSHCSIMNNKISNKPSSVLGYAGLSGLSPNANNALGVFKGVLKDYVNYTNKQAQKPPPIQFDSTQLDSVAASGNYDSLLSNISSGGFVDSTQKDNYINGISNYILNKGIDPMSQLGQTLTNLKASVESVGVSLFSSSNQANSMMTDPRYRFLGDNLGSCLKNTADLKFDNLNNYAIPGTPDYDLLTNNFLPTLDKAKANSDLMTRSVSIGSFNDLDFGSIMSTSSSPGLDALMADNSVQGTSYKLYDLDSTSNSVAIDIPDYKLKQTKVYDDSVYAPYNMDPNDLETLDPQGIGGDNLTASKAIYSCKITDYPAPQQATIKTTYSNSTTTTTGGSIYTNGDTGYTQVSSYNSTVNTSSYSTTIGDPEVGNIFDTIDTSESSSLW